MAKKSDRIRRRALMQKFIVDYLNENGGTDVLDQDFHERFHQEFGGKRKETFWGAQPVDEAMKMLKSLCDQGILNRAVLGLGVNWQPGFPKWVWTYALNPAYRRKG